MRLPLLSTLVFCSGLAGAAAGATDGVPVDRGMSMDWSVPRGNAGGNQYVDLAQIHAANVHLLKPVWEYHAGGATPRSNMHSTPLIVDGLLYASTPAMHAVAVDAATGEERWRFDPAKHNDGTVIRLRNRGLTYWKGAAGERVFHYVKDRVYALEARTGKLIESFGKSGWVDLRENLAVDPSTVALEMTNPGSIYKNILILGSRVNEGYGSAPGHIRAFDAVTGAFKWIFHTIPQKGEYGYDTWKWVEGETYGGANAWGGVTIDEKRGWAFVSTGSATEDYYGGFRKGTNLFANCVLVLDATTGERKWHYQTVHHDLWDYDNPPAPILVTIRKDGVSRDAVVQLTKMGFTFVLDRETGEPLFPVHEVPVPRSTIPGEETWPTQPIPSLPRSLVRQAVTEADLTAITPEARAFVLKEFRRYIAGGLYTPPSLQGTIMTPGWFGGVEWGGASFDPTSNVLYVNANDAPAINRVRPVYTPPSDVKLEPAHLGRRIYEATCMSCHRAGREGVPPIIPTLVGVLDRLKPDDIRTVLRLGKNSMPAFNQLRAPEVDAVLAFLKSPVAESSVTSSAPAASKAPARYASEGTRLLVDNEGYPGISPPWGTLNAVDLGSGEVLWQVPLGEYPGLVAKGIRNTGTLNFGGPVATPGGVIFIAATADEKIRAFEKHSGKVLWEHALPAGGYAVPSVYMLNGKQYVVITAGGGGKNATKSGDSIMAFALPDSETRSPTTGVAPAAKDAEWINLFDGETLEGWVHLNGWHTYTVEDGAIVGRTREGSPNSFLCTLQEFDDFEFEVETTVDRVTNQGIQFRSQVRPVTISLADGRGGEQFRAGRVYGPQAEIRRYYKGQPTTGVLYGEALGTGWLTAREKLENGHQHFHDEGWNKLRIVAKGPRMQTWVNDQPVEDLVREDVYKTHPKGFIALQIHGLNGREPGFQEHGLKTNEPLVMKWRNIRIRPLPKD